MLAVSQTRQLAVIGHLPARLAITSVRWTRRTAALERADCPFRCASGPADCYGRQV